MKTGIHPEYRSIKVKCACGNEMAIGTTLESLSVEVCSKCHPFYTGKMRIVDTTNVVKKFEERRKGAAETVVNRRQKRAEKRQSRTSVGKQPAGKALTLKDMLSQVS